MTSLFAVPSRVPIGTDDNGRPVMITRAWLDFINEQLFNRVGGTTAPTNSELVVDMHDDAGIEEMKLDLFSTRDGISQGPPPAVLAIPDDQSQAPPGAFFSPTEDPSARLEALEARVQTLIRQIDDLKQGTLS